MPEAVRKAWATLQTSLSRALGIAVPSDSEPPKVGGYRVDYSELTREEIDAPLDPALEELYKNSKVISTKREL
jgi:hypothetical protein